MDLKKFSLLLFVIITTVVSQTTEQSAQLSQIVGSVEVRSGGSAAWRKAKIGMPVRAKWDIRTYLESSAELTLETGTVIKISENSVISLSKLNKDAASNTQSNVKVLSGQMWANVKKMTNSKSQFDFETPTAVASIRGTRLGIEVSKERTRIDVYEGLVAVRKRNSNTSVTVKPNFRAMVDNISNDVSVVEFKEVKKADTSAVAPDDPFVTGGTKVDSLGIIQSAADTILKPDTSKSDSAKVDAKAAVPDSTDVQTVRDTVKQITDTVLFKKDSLMQRKDTLTQQKRDSLTQPKDTVKQQINPAKKDSVSLPKDKLTEPAIGKTDSIPKKSMTPATGEKTTSAPVLQILSPISGSIVQESPAVLKGKTTAGATVKINSKTIETGSDGAFAELVELKRGPNTIAVVSMLSGLQSNQQVKIDYRPRLELTVGNIEDNMEVSSKIVQLDISVSENAKFSTNGKEGEVNVILTEGRNMIIIEAWDEWNTRTVKQFQVIYKPGSKFSLNVLSPTDGMRIKEPFIQVTGSTTSGAKVYVNDVILQTGRDGFFSSRMPIPDEPQEYSLEIRAELAGQELAENRTVIYEPLKEKMILEVTSPQNGQRIDRKVIHVAGKTTPQSQLLVNNIQAPVLVNGTFSVDIPLLEKDIGDLTIDITARNQDQEISKSINVTVNGNSNQINTSIPQCIVQTKNLVATRFNTVMIQSLDRTPEDQLVLTVINNGVTDQYQTMSGKREQYSFQEGKNSYIISIKDMAGNISNVVNGELYYLPGPISISIIEPSSNPYTINGVPPMPGKIGLKPAQVQIEIDDGIGRVPETIKYCKLIGNGQTILMRNNNDYIYRCDASVLRGKNYFTIQVEDIAGNTAIERLEISIGD